MKLSDIPVDWFAIRCIQCLEFLALPPNHTVADREQLAADHRALCPGPKQPEAPV